MAIFFVSPRIIDFDAFLPTAMQLKHERPNWDIRFVTFSKENFDFISHNPTHVEALRRTGRLYYLGWETGESAVARILLRIRTFFLVVAWLLRLSQPLILLGLPFTAEPYAMWRAIARLRAGRAVTLWKFRSPDMVLYRVRKVRKDPPKGHPPSFVAKRFTRDTDLFVHYHDEEETNIEWARPYGRLDNVDQIMIGMPHWLPAWRCLIDDQVQLARKELIDLGVPEDAELYTTFPAKVWSAESLRDKEAIVWTFLKACDAILEGRPNAFILMRPHPKAIETPYYEKVLSDSGGRAMICLRHPEVLLRLCHRAVFNNPTNILFSCFMGKMIDVSDYHPEHYEEFGQRSLADGFGPVYINPRAPDFEALFHAALSDDELFNHPSVCRNRDRLLERNPAEITKFLRWAESAEREDSHSLTRYKAS